MDCVFAVATPHLPSHVFFFAYSSSVSHSALFASKFLTLTLMYAFSSVTLVPAGIEIGTLPTRDSFGAFPGSRICVLARTTSADGRDALLLVEAAPAAGMARLRSIEVDCIECAAQSKASEREREGSTRRGKARAN